MIKLLTPQFFKPTSRFVIVLISIVQIAVFFSIAQFNGNEVLPKPSGVAKSILKTLMDERFFDNFFSTLWLIVKSMTIASIVSLLFVYIVKIPALGGISVFISKLRFLTYTGLAFVFTIMIHNGSDIKISLLLFGIIPFFVTSLLAYINDISQKEYELAASLKFNNWKILYEVIIRGKLHLALEVIRQNFAIAWMMITSAEGLCMSEGGLGTMMIKSNKYLKIDDVFAVLVIIFLLGVMFDYLFDLAKVWMFPYVDTKRNAKLWINKPIRLITVSTWTNDTGK